MRFRQAGSFYGRASRRVSVHRGARACCQTAAPTTQLRSTAPVAVTCRTGVRGAQTPARCTTPGPPLNPALRRTWGPARPLPARETSRHRAPAAAARAAAFESLRRAPADAYRRRPRRRRAFTSIWCSAKAKRSWAEWRSRSMWRERREPAGKKGPGRRSMTPGRLAPQDG